MKERDRYPAGYIAAATLSVLAWPVLYGLESFNQAFCGSNSDRISTGISVFIILYMVITVVLTGIFGVINIVRSFRLFRSGQWELCAKNCMKLKYGMIPCFLINCYVLFLFGAVIWVLSSGASMIWYVPLAFLITWVYLFPGAFYGIQVIRICRKEKQKNLLWCFGHGILQFCFLVDVPDAAWLTARELGTGKKAARIVCGGYLVAACIFLYLTLGK